MRFLTLGNIYKFLGIGILLVLGTLWYAPNFIPAETYKNQIAERIEAMTGRKVTIKGEVKLKFLPRFSLSMHDVSISQPRGFASKEPMVHLQSLNFVLQVLPMLGGQIVVDRLDLIQPAILLARDAKGKPNWVFEPKEPSRKQKEDAPKQPSTGSELALVGAVIHDGKITYRESPQAKPKLADQLHAELSIPSLHSALSLAGNARINGKETFRFKSTLSTPDSWLKQKTAFLTLQAEHGDLQLAISGSVEDKETGPVLEGSFKLDSATLVPNNPLSAKSKITLKPDALEMLSLTDLQVTFGSSTLTGKLVATIINDSPLVTATLKSESVVALLPPAEAKIQAQETESKDSAKQTGWSNDAAIGDLAFLRDFDADLTLDLAGVQADKLTLGAFILSGTLEDGMAKLSLPTLPLYDGTASAELVLDARGDSPIITKDVTMQGVNAQDFLSAAYGFDRLAGKTNATLSFRTKGVSEEQWMKNLSGKGSLHLTDGKIKGVNIAALLQQASSLKAAIKPQEVNAAAPANSSEAVTEFSELTGTFIITDGILSNKDLSLKAPLMTASGKGTVNLPERTVNYTLKPSLVGNAQAMSGKLTIPVKVTGTFDHLSFLPDAGAMIEDIVNDPDAAVKNLKDNVKGLGKDLKTLFKGL